MAPLEMKRGKDDDYGQQLVESREERQAEGDAAEDGLLLEQQEGSEEQEK